MDFAPFLTPKHYLNTSNVNSAGTANLYDKQRYMVGVLKNKFLVNHLLVN